MFETYMMILAAIGATAFVVFIVIGLVAFIKEIFDV